MDNHCFFFSWSIADTIRCRLVFESVRGNPLWPDLIWSDQTNRIKQRKGTELQQMSYLYMLCCILIFMMKRVTVCGKGIFHSTQFCINSIFFGLGYELEADRQSALLFIFHNSVLTNWWLYFHWWLFNESHLLFMILRFWFSVLILYLLNSVS